MKIVENRWKVVRKGQAEKKENVKLIQSKLEIKPESESPQVVPFSS